MKTGLEHHAKFLVDEDQKKDSGLVGGLKSLAVEEKKTFKCYDKKIKEFPDLNVLYTGSLENSDKEKNVQKTLLPSMIMCFNSTKDQELEEKYLEVITRCYN